MFGTMVLLLAVFASGTFGQTLSFYNDKEQSVDNVFTAGLVDFILTDTPFSSLSSTTDWAVDVTPNEFSNPFYYYASSTDFVGDVTLCQGLTVTATLDGEVMYSGLLTDLVTGTTTLIDTWTFDFDDFEQYAGQSCKFFVEYNSWQTRHGMDQGGYSDTERVMYTITVPSLLLGKVYFTNNCPEIDEAVTIASGTNSCNDTQTWVEIYNRTNVDIDTSGWRLCSSDSCFTIAGSQYTDSTVILAGEYGILAADPEIHTQISVPFGVLPIVTDGVWFASDLSPNGDMLQLIDTNNLVIDQLNWGISTTSWSNYTSNLWADNSLMATSGYALARLPIGFDSNQPDDWALLGVPTLTIDSIEPEPLVPGATTTVKYTAINTNGLSEDLRIDMYMFEIDDTLHLIELDIENTGEYSFVLPEGLDGPLRIKPVATSPENILLNARAVSGMLPIATSTATSTAFASATDSPVSTSTASTTVDIASTSTTTATSTSVAATTTAVSTQTASRSGSSGGSRSSSAIDVTPLATSTGTTTDQAVDFETATSTEEVATSTIEIAEDTIVETVSGTTTVATTTADILEESTATSTEEIEIEAVEPAIIVVATSTEESLVDEIESEVTEEEDLEEEAIEPDVEVTTGTSTEEEV